MIDLVGIDTETDLFGPGRQAPPIACLTWAFQSGHKGIYAGSEDPIRYMEGLLHEAAAGRARIVGHNVAYDMACLMAAAPHLAKPIFDAYEAGGVHCTEVREKLIQIANGKLRDGMGRAKGQFALDTVAKDHTGRILNKLNPWRQRFGELLNVPLEQWPQEPIDYALEDADVLIPIHRSQAEAARRLNYVQYEAETARQTAYDFALRLTSCWGMLVDHPYARSLYDAASKEVLELQAKLRHYGLGRFEGRANPKFTKSLTAIRALVESTWKGEGRPPRTDGSETKPGQTKYDADTLAMCRQTDELVTLSRYFELEKYVSGFFEQLVLAGYDPVHASYDVLGATSGRTSCYKPNIQQMPKLHGVRQAFYARDGFAFCTVDYDAQELHTLAQTQIDMLGRSTLARRFQEDPYFDPHLEFAAARLGLSYEQALHLKKIEDKAVADARQRAKAANFGFPGGLGASGFIAYARGYGLDLTLDESKTIKDAWMHAWPDMRPYFHVIRSLADSGRPLVDPRSGRMRAVNRDRPFTSTANDAFQGPASNCSKSGVWEVVKRCYVRELLSPLYGSRPVAFLHDELMLEVPLTRMHEAGEEQAKVMCAAMQRWTPDVPVTASPTLMRRWYKEAKEVRVNGQLQIWEPKEKAAA